MFRVSVSFRVSSRRVRDSRVRGATHSSRVRSSTHAASRGSLRRSFRKRAREREEIIAGRLETSFPRERESIARGVVRLGALEEREIEPGRVAVVSEDAMIGVGFDQPRGEDVGRDHGSRRTRRGSGPKANERVGRAPAGGLEHAMGTADAHGFEIERASHGRKPRVARGDAVRAHEPVLLGGVERDDERAGAHVVGAFDRAVGERARRLDGDGDVSGVVESAGRDVDGVYVRRDERGGVRTGVVGVPVAMAHAHGEGSEVGVDHRLFARHRRAWTAKRELTRVRRAKDLDRDGRIRTRTRARADGLEGRLDAVERRRLRVRTGDARTRVLEETREGHRARLGEDGGRGVLRRSAGVFGRGRGRQAEGGTRGRETTRREDRDDATRGSRRRDARIETRARMRADRTPRPLAAPEQAGETTSRPRKRDARTAGSGRGRRTSNARLHRHASATSAHAAKSW